MQTSISGVICNDKVSSTMLDIAYLHQKPTLHQSPVHHAGRRGKKVRWKAATVNETGSGKSELGRPP